MDTKFNPLRRNDLIPYLIPCKHEIKGYYMNKPETAQLRTFKLLLGFDLIWNFLKPINYGEGGFQSGTNRAVMDLHDP